MPSSDNNLASLLQCLTSPRDTSSGSSASDVKNHAVLFFLDHLMTKNGPRSIHDLSCQFGSRGFTEEMRSAVGGTQDSLRDFLSAYPSLFKIDGDQVSVNLLSGSSDSPEAPAEVPVALGIPRDRDAEVEAIKFFEEKLKKFGPEMPVKSLLGHRSQACPEIRMISGRHLKEFTEFLGSRPDNFVLDGDRVRLRVMPEPLSPADEYDEEGNPLTGVSAQQAAIDFFRMLLEGTEIAIPVDQLYRAFCNRFSHRLRQDVATNPKELSVFLKSNRDIFFIRSNKVTLVRERPGTDEEGKKDSLNDSTNGLAHDCLSDSDSSRAPNQDPLETSSNGSDTLLDYVCVLSSVKQAKHAIETLIDQSVGRSKSPGNSSGSEDRVSRAEPLLPRVLSADFKLVTLGEQEFLALVVLGTMSGRLYVFDVAHSAMILLETGLKELLESNSWTKIIHECDNISSLLYAQYKIRLANVFDTQIAHRTIIHQRTKQMVKLIKPASLFTLQHLYSPQSFMCSTLNPQFRQTLRQDQRYWSTRPLSDEMLQAAVEEAYVLLMLYDSMSALITPQFLGAFFDMCRDASTTGLEGERSSSVGQQRAKKSTLVRLDDIESPPPGSNLRPEAEPFIPMALRQLTRPPPLLFNSSPPSSTSQVSSKLSKMMNLSSTTSNKAPHMVDSASQTISTGDIVMTRVYNE